LETKQFLTATGSLANEIGTQAIGGKLFEAANMLEKRNEIGRV